MRKLLLIIFLLLAVQIFAQEHSVMPSIYYTYGKYSNNTSSNSGAFYGSFYLNFHDYIIGAFEDLKIDNPDWSYNQNMFILGGLKNLYPFFIKLNYAHINGEYSYKPFPFEYSDKINILNSEVIYNYGLSYAGISFTYLALNGFNSLNIYQPGLYIGAYLSNKFFISLRPYYSYLTDRRRLFSVRAKLNYFPSNEFNISIAGSIGNRAYFFDPEYLTIFNQPETQNFWSEIRGSYFLVNNLKIIALYQYTNFKSSDILIEDYNISYFGCGIVYSVKW